MSTTIRPATLEDLPDLAQALESLELFRAYKLDAPSLEKRFAQALERKEGLLVAYDGDTPLGVCWFIHRGAFGTGAYLRTLAIRDEAQGKGVGAELLVAYENGSNDPPGGWFLLTSDFNKGAQRFYERYGYKLVGELPSFAAPGVTEKVYWKPRQR